MFTKFKDTGALFDLFNSSGAIHAYMGLYDKCLKCLSVAGTLLPTKTDPGRLGVLNNNTGMAHAGRQNFKMAKQSFDNAMGQYRKTGDEKGIATVLVNYGNMYESLADYAKAKGQLQQSLDTARRIHDARGESVALTNLGNVYLRTGKYNEALKNYEDALEIAKKRGITQFVGDNLNNIGLVRIIQGRFLEASKLFEQSYLLFEEVGSLLGRSWSLHNLSYVYRDIGKLKESLKCSRKALWLAETTGSRRVRAAVLQRRGGLYEYLGVFEGAVTSFEEAERIQKDIGDRYFRSNCLADIGWERTRRKSFDRAKAAFEEAIRMRKETGGPNSRLWLRYALIFIEKPQYDTESCPPLHELVKVSSDRAKDLETADKYLKKASDVIQKDNLEDQLLLAYVKARLIFETHPKESAVQFGNLKDQAKTLGSGKYSFLASTCEGLAYERLKNLDDAGKSYSEAESYIAEMEKDLPADDMTNFRQGEQILGIKNDLASEGLARIKST